MTTSLDENIARTWLWMDQYEEAQVNQYSFNVLLLVKLYSTANVSGVAAPPANTQLQESVGAQLDNKLGCSNTVLDFKALVSTWSSVQSNQASCKCVEQCQLIRHCQFHVPGSVSKSDPPAEVQEDCQGGQEPGGRDTDH